MSQQLDQLSNAVLSLSASERAELAERIWSSVTDDEQLAIDQAWCEEIDRRIARADSAPAIPAEQVFTQIETELMDWQDEPGDA